MRRRRLLLLRNHSHGRIWTFFWKKKNISFFPRWKTYGSRWNVSSPYPNIWFSRRWIESQPHKSFSRTDTHEAVVVLFIYLLGIARHNLSKNPTDTKEQNLQKKIHYLSELKLRVLSERRQRHNFHCILDICNEAKGLESAHLFVVIFAICFDGQRREKRREELMGMRSNVSPMESINTTKMREFLNFWDSSKAQITYDGKSLTNLDAIWFFRARWLRRTRIV